MIPFFLAQIQPVEPTIVNQSGQEFVIDAGVLSENQKNIFHTFEQFGLTQEQIANFLANPETENIFNRVIGNDPSFIDGLIQVTGGNPDFYLLNPNGIIFGQNAQINVPAAFYGSTATSLQFGNDGFPLYAGEEWFATPFAIGEGIDASNGDPTFLIFGAGLHNPILNLGTIQAEKIDLSGGSVVSLGELQAEDIRFSVGFNSIPWKIEIATDRDFWTIVPRSAFSSVYPSVDLQIDEDSEDSEDRYIFIFSDPIARLLAIEFLTFEPFDFSISVFGLGDSVSNQNVQVFRVGNLGQDFLIDLNLAIQPELELPGDSVVDMPDDPVTELSDDPLVDMPNDPVTELPGDPVVDIPDDPVTELPGDPVVDIPDDPVIELPGDPLVDMPNDPVTELSDDPLVDMPDDLVIELSDTFLDDLFVRDSQEFSNVSFRFLETGQLSLFLPTYICYYPRLIQNNRRCLLKLNIQRNSYSEITEEEFNTFSRE